VKDTGCEVHHYAIFTLLTTMVIKQGNTENWNILTVVQIRQKCLSDDTKNPTAREHGSETSIYKFQHQ
jgi:hypothetical protein